MSPLDTQLAGVGEPVGPSIQQHGPHAGSECTTILVGRDSGRFYCAEPGCGYSAAKWTSVFAHRSSHARAAKVRPGGAGAHLVASVVQNRLVELTEENAALRDKLASEKARRVTAERRLASARRVVSA